MSAENVPQAICIDFDPESEEWVVRVRDGVRFPGREPQVLRRAVALALKVGHRTGGMIEITHPGGRIERLDMSDHPPLLAD